MTPCTAPPYAGHTHMPPMHSTHMPPMQHSSTAHTCRGTHAQHSSTAAHMHRGTAQQHSTHMHHATHAQHSTHINCLMYAGGRGSAENNYLFNGVGGRGTPCSTAHTLNKQWGRGVRPAQHHHRAAPCTYKKTKKLFKIGGRGVNNYLFKTQGTVQTAAVRAMNRAEKSDFLAGYVPTVLQTPRHVRVSAR